MRKLFLFYFFCIVFSNTLYAKDKFSHVKRISDKIINIGIADNPITLDPQRMEDQISYRIGYDLYEGLMTEAEDGRIIPGIAESYRVSDDGITYTFYLRKNAKFSDGTQITASDVVFTFQRLSDPNLASPSSYMSRFIQNSEDILRGEKPVKELGIKAIDQTTVQIILKHPVPFFLNLIATGNFGIIKEENIKKYKNSFTEPGKLVSSGAYKLIFSKLNEKFTAQKNYYYWNVHNTQIETVNYFPIIDTNTELQMYRAGQIDFTFTLPPTNINSIRKSFLNELKIHPLLGIYYLTLNMRKEPFKSNLKLRQALSMAVDRNVLTKDILGRTEMSAYDLIPYGTMNYTPQKYEWASLPNHELLKKAKNIFQEAGYSAKNPFKITMTYQPDLMHKKVILGIVAMWQKAFGKENIIVTLEKLERKVFLDSIQKGDFFIARDSWFADYNDASVFTELLVSKNLQNFSGYHNPIFDEIHQEADFEQNILKRKALFEKAMNSALSDYPVIPLFSYVSIHLVKPYVRGYTGRNILDHIYTRNLYLSKN